METFKSVSETTMSIFSDNPIGGPKFYPVPPLPAGMSPLRSNGASDQGSFENLIKEAAGTTDPTNMKPDEKPSISKDKLLEFAQMMKLQTNQSLLRITSDQESESRSGEDGMADLLGSSSTKDIFSSIPSIIRRGASETDMPNPVATVGNKPKALAGPGNPDPTSGIDEIIRKASTTYDVDFELIKGVIQAESNFNPNAISPKGAMGLMQLMPMTAKELGVTDPMDPAANVMGGTKYLKRLLDRYDGNVPRALAAYNWGMGNLESSRGRLPEETRNYVSKITRYYRDRSEAIA